MFEYNVYLLINKPTSITPSSLTAIDHIWTNVTGVKVKSFILAHKVSDHFEVMQISNVGFPSLKHALGTG